MIDPRKLSRSKSARGRNRAILETLEQRQLFTVDLSASFVSIATSPYTVGTKQTATLHITNNGTTKASGALAIDMYAMVNLLEFHLGDATYLYRINTSISLNASASQDVVVQIPISPALAPTAYRFDAVLDAAGKFAEVDETNNVAESDVFTVTTLNYDLAPSAGKLTVPSTLVEGDQVAGTAQVIITNATPSSATIVAGVSVGVQILARPADALDGNSDILINKSAVLAPVGGLAPTKTKTATVPLTFTNLTAGTYRVFAKIDTGNALTETSELNNEIDLNTTFTVTPRTTQLTLTTNSGLKFPTGTIVFDGTRAVPLKFDVAVSGNRPFGATETFNVQIVAHPHDGLSPDFEIYNTGEIKPGAIQVGKSKTITVNALLPYGQTTNDYDFIATIQPHLTSDSGTDNTATTSVVLAPLHILAGFTDLQTSIASTTLPSAVVQGQAKSGATKIDITNTGNTTMPSPLKINLSLDLHPANATDSTQDIHIGILNNQSIAKLLPNAKKTFTVNGTLSALLASGDYVPVARFSPAQLFMDDFLDNNSANGNTITVADPFVNLDIATATQGFGANVLGGAVANGTVTIANKGNVAAVGSVDVQFYATTTGDIEDGVLVGDKSFAINLLNGKTSSTFTVPITLPTGSESTYTLIAKVTPTGFVDTNPGDDTQAAAGSVHASEAHVDLVLNAVGTTLGSNAHGGDTGTVTLTVGNLGNIPVGGDATITLYATTDSSVNAGATNATQGGTLTVHNISINANGVSGQQKIALVVPNPAALADIKIFARVTPGDITDSDTTNNDTLVTTISTQHVDLPMDARFGNTIKFTSTTSGPGFDSGTFVTNTGLTGQYFFPYTTPFLALTSDPGMAYPGYSITFTRNGFSLKGKTYAFSFNPTGAIGTVTISGNTVYYK